MLCWGALTIFPYELRLKNFLRPEGAGAPTAPPGYAYAYYYSRIAGGSQMIMMMIISHIGDGNARCEVLPCNHSCEEKFRTESSKQRVLCGFLLPSASVYKSLPASRTCAINFRFTSRELRTDTHTHTQTRYPACDADI